MRLLSRTFAMGSALLVLALVTTVAIDQRILRLDLKGSSRLTLITEPISLAMVGFFVFATFAPLLIWEMHAPDSGIPSRRLLGQALGASGLWAVFSALLMVLAPLLITHPPTPGTLDARVASDPMESWLLVCLVVTSANFGLGLSMPGLTQISFRPWRIACYVGWALFGVSLLVWFWNANERATPAGVVLVVLAISFAVLIASVFVVGRWRTDLPEEIREEIPGQVWTGHPAAVTPLGAPIDQLRLCAALRAAADRTPFWVFVADDDVEVGWQLDDPELARALRLVPGQRVPTIRLSFDKRQRVVRHGELHQLTADESGFQSGRREYGGPDIPGWFERTPAGRDLARFVDEALQRLEVPTSSARPWSQLALTWLFLVVLVGGGGYLLVWVVDALFYRH